MTITIDDADAQLKQRHRAMWASGDYPKLAEEVITELGPTLAGAVVQRGDDVLDIGAGSGNASIPAALAGAQVTASDLTPELFVRGRELAAEAGVDIDWVTADAELLPFPDASFDTVISCVGIMFAPHHPASANELLRVTRSGGRIGMINWTPQGLIGRMFSTMKPYAPTPPPGAQPGPLWGDEQHVRGLFGEGIADVTAQKRDLVVDAFASPAEFRDYFKAYYGPTISTYRNLGDDQVRIAELDAALEQLAADAAEPGSGFRMRWEYLLFTARKR